MSSTLKNNSLLNIMPSNMAADEQVAAAGKSIDVAIMKLNEQAAYCLLIARLDELPDEVVDSLAWQFHVDAYDTALPIKTKRSLVEKSIGWHRIKGTPAAVEDVVSTVFKKAEVQEWWEYGGKPYMFRIITSGFRADGDNAKQLIKTIQATKNTRSHLDSITVDLNPKENSEADTALYVGSLHQLGGRKRIGIPAPEDTKSELYAGTVKQLGGRKRIGIPAPPDMQAGAYVGTLRIRTGTVEIGGIR